VKAIYYSDGIKGDKIIGPAIKLQAKGGQNPFFIRQVIKIAYF